jgi:hypothetical protein
MTPMDDAAAHEMPPEPDVEERRRTFRLFAKGMFLFAGHALAILLILFLVVYY